MRLGRAHAVTDRRQSVRPIDSPLMLRDRRVNQGLRYKLRLTSYLMRSNPCARGEVGVSSHHCMLRPQIQMSHMQHMNPSTLDAQDSVSGQCFCNDRLFLTSANMAFHCGMSNLSDDEFSKSPCGPNRGMYLGKSCITCTSSGRLRPIQISSVVQRSL